MQVAYIFQISILIVGITIGCILAPTKKDGYFILVVSVFALFMVIVDFVFFGGHAIRDKLLFEGASPIKGHRFEIVGLMIGVAIGKAYWLIRNKLGNKK